MVVTLDQLLAIMQCPQTLGELYVDPFNLAMAKAEINTPLRMAHFLAQCAHESAGLRWVKELAAPGKRPGEQYEGRLDLGNTHPGDGVKYPGRGPIQVTGRGNYTRLSAFSGVDYVNHPEWLERPQDGCLGSAWYWLYKKINTWADKDDILRVSTAINGRNKDGLPNHWPERQAKTRLAKSVLLAS